MKKFGHGHRLSRRWFPRSYLAHCSDTFGFMFPILARRPAKTLRYTPAVRALLEQLGTEIGNKPNVNDSGLPAGYTYLGQFVDHDITLDPFSDIDHTHTAAEVEQLNNFRTPNLDLDSVYGRGPSVDPHLYINNSGDPQEDGIKLLLGNNTPTGPGGPDDSSGDQIARNDFDVPRTTVNTAIIGDPRNNENLFVSQIHHAFLKFHNKVVDKFKNTVPDEALFDTARKMVVHHYQYVVVHDYLRRIALVSEVDSSLQNQRFFRRQPFRMPVEFAVAAYRFGHSLVRAQYDFNDNFIGSSFMNAFTFARDPNLPVLSNWVVDLNRFVVTGSGHTVNLAKTFDTALAPVLNSLPSHPVGSFMASLAQRNLVRGLALRVPTGQAVAQRLGVPVLSEAELLQNTSAAEEATLRASSKKLLKKTPLWYYILKEAEVKQNGSRLGRVGSIIVAETFTRILRDDPDSILNNTFVPSLDRLPGRPAGGFDLADLLNFAGVLQ